LCSYKTGSHEVKDDMLRKRRSSSIFVLLLIHFWELFGVLLGLTRDLRRFCKIVHACCLRSCLRRIYTLFVPVPRQLSSCHAVCTTNH